MPTRQTLRRRIAVSRTGAVDPPGQLDGELAAEGVGMRLWWTTWALLLAVAPASAQEQPAKVTSENGEVTAEEPALTPEPVQGEPSKNESPQAIPTEAATEDSAPPTTTESKPPQAPKKDIPDAAQLARENEILRLKLELAQARLDVEREHAARANRLVQMPSAQDIVANSDDENAVRPAARFYAFNLGLNGLTRNISAGMTLKYLWAVQTAFTADVLLTPLINGLALDDLDSVRFTAEQTAGWRLSMFPFKFMPRNVRKPSGPWPDLIFGGGVWGLLEVDHLAQAFRLGDAGLFAALTVGPFIGVSFQDVNLALAYRPFSIAAFFLDGQWDQRPFAFGNPIIDVSITWTLPL